MADDFNKVNYDRIFKEEKVVTEKPLKKISSIGSRIGEIFFGIMFGGFAIVMLGFLLLSAINDIGERFTHNTAKAVIIEKIGSPEDSKIELSWELSVDGRKYSGKKTLDEESDEKLFSKLSQSKTGDKITITYLPSNPTKNFLYEEYDPSTIFMMLFIVPFIAIGYMATTGKVKQSDKSTSTTDASAKNGDIILMLFVFCCPAAFAFTFLNTMKILPYQILLIIFFVYSLVLVPFTTKAIHRKFVSKKSATKSTSSESGLSEISADDEQDSASEASFMKEVGFLLFFTIFWCAIVGASIGVMGHGMYRYVLAKETFVSTQGKVLSSTVKSHHDGDSTTYSPEIKYVYHVNGKKYIGKNYELSGGSSSSGGWADRIVRENPKGKKVTVYYAPSNPSDAALAMAVPSFAKVLILFLQPFIVAGVYMVCLTFITASGYLKSKNIQARHGSLKPCRENLWGKPEISSSTLKISSKNSPHIFLTFVGVYFITTFVMLFIAAIGYDFDLTLDQSIMWIKIAAGIAGVFVVISVLKYFFSRPEILTINQITGSVSFESKKKNWQIPLRDIRCLRVQEEITRVQQNNQPLKIYHLQMLDGSNMPYDIHTQKNSMVSDRLMRAKFILAGKTLATFIGCKMEEKIEKDSKSKELPVILKKIFKVTKKN